MRVKIKSAKGLNSYSQFFKETVYYLSSTLMHEVTVYLTYSTRHCKTPSICSSAAHL